MIELAILLAQYGGDTNISCAEQYPVVVCSKRKLYNNRIRNMSFYIKQTNGKQETAVNRCTYLASEVGKPIVIKVERTFCDSEVITSFRSAWLY